jgi:tRNA G18 (ribose-2'-O)-methylase SpoU
MSTPVNDLDPVKWNVADEYQQLTPAEFATEYAKIADTTAVGCINLSGDINIGMMIRTAAMFGVGRFYVLGRRCYDRRTAVGTQNHIPVERINTTVDVSSNPVLSDEMLISVIRDLQKTYTVIFLEQRPQSISVYDLHAIDLLGKPPMFLFGCESTGIPASVLNIENTHCVVIPQRGIGRSLNVSVACGITLAQWYKPRQ